MDELIQIVDDSQLNQSVEQVIETLQLPPDMADNLYTLLYHWLDDNGYEVIDEG